jgi:hypothetical protein
MTSNKLSVIEDKPLGHIALGRGVYGVSLLLTYLVSFFF